MNNVLSDITFGNVAAEADGEYEGEISIPKYLQTIIDNLATDCFTTCGFKFDWAKAKALKDGLLFECATAAHTYDELKKMGDEKTNILLRKDKNGAPYYIVQTMFN